MTKTWEVFRFELAYQFGRLSTRLYFAIFVAFALALDFAIFIDARNDGYFFNAPVVTGLITIVTSMLSLLIAAGVAGDAATRDEQLRIQSLLYTTPLRERSYIGGRFLGAFAILALLLLAVPFGLLVATSIPGLDPQVLGPFRPQAYLTSYFFLAVPNAFVATAVLFALAMLTRRAIAAYAGAGALFFSAFIVEGFIGGKFGKWDLAKLVDPLGYTPLVALWRTYNPLQKNNNLIPLDGALLSNRVLWVGVAFAVLSLAVLRFRFAYATGGGASRRTATIEDVPTLRWTGLTVPKARRSFTFGARMRQLLAIALDSLRDLHRSRAWWILPFTAILFITTAAEILQVELATPGAATTGRVADILAGSELTRLVAILIAISAGELVWRERDTRMNAIADVTPIPEWLSFLGRFLALALMLVVSMAVFGASAMIVQAMLGHYDFQPLLYLQSLFGFQLAGYLLFAALAMAIHVLVNQKYVGNVLAILAYIGVQMARELGVEHNLLLYGGAPEPQYTEMGGFGAQLGPWRWFTLYWSGWALLAAVVAYLFWVRGDERGARWRLALARRRITRRPAGVAVVAVGIVAGAGGYVFYNTNVLNPYRTAAESEELRAEYERRFGKYAKLPQPMLAAKSLHVDFFPERRAATIRGTYRLENRTSVSIDAIHVVSHAEVETKDITFDRPSRLTETDARHGYRIFALGQPLAPGQSLRMHFQVVFAPRGFTNRGWNPSVTDNGSWFQHRGEQNHGQRQWLPFVGYQENRELHNEAARRLHGLPPKPAIATLEDIAARNDQQGREKIAFEAIVGTDAPQIGVAPGHLRREWTTNGRRYRHYVTDAPITNTYAIYSARYAVQRAQWRDASGQTVDIEVLHHPPHTRNLDRMLQSVRASLDYHTREYGPYPHKLLRLVQYPSTGRGLGLTSFPGMIEFSDGYALVRPEADAHAIDLPFAVMAHEMGHQWFGHQLMPALVEGAPILSESLSWYSAMMIVERTLGREHLTRLLDIMRAEYMAPHQTRDVPLLRTWNGFDGYRIGPFALFAVREALGEARVNAALRRLLARFDPARPPYPTSLDLYHELRASAPADKHALLADVFERITYWDLRTKKLTVQPTANAYRATLHIEAQKLTANAAGHERPVPMHDPIEVAIYDADSKPLYRAVHPIRSGAQQITVTVPRPPTRATIDPDHELLDRKPEDNSATP